MEEISTKPYLLRAIYEWCTDNGYTPHLAVAVDANTRVPMQYVKDGQIVLNISFDATSGLKMENDVIRFNARFGGVSRDISIPVTNVIAIYAQENGQGMAFEVTAPPVELPASEHENVSGNEEELVEDIVPEKPVHTRPSLVAVSDNADTDTDEKSVSEKNTEKNTKKSKKPVLKLIK